MCRIVWIVFIIFLCFIRLDALTTYQLMKIEEVTFPKTKNRTAVLVSGQLRSGNITWTSKGIKKDYAVNYFSDEDPSTPIETILEFVIRPLALYGGIDVFIYIQIPPNSTHPSLISWNGDPLTYKESYRDYTLCKLYSNHAIFRAEKGNRVYCMTDYEKELSNPFIDSYDFWTWYYYADIPLAKEMLLQQLYGIYRANLASKQIELAENISYTYKLRLRPDIAAVKEFPSLEKFTFSYPSPDCPLAVYYPSLLTYRLGGAEDSFNFGLAKDMNYLLDRYMDMISTPFVNSYCKYRKSSWCAESYLMALMKERYHICVKEHPDIWISNIRRVDYKLGFHPLNISKNYWKIVNTDK